MNKKIKKKKIYIYIYTPDERKLWKKTFFCSLHALAILIKMYMQFQ